jgi:hypothetical protein
MRWRSRLVALSLASLSGAVAVTAGAGGTTGPDVLVRLRPGAGQGATARLVAAGAVQVSSEIRLWKLSGRAAARTLPALRRTGVVAAAHAESTYRAVVSSTAAPDPLVGQQWWRSAIGVEGLTAPGPGVPVTIVDSGVDLSHPELAGRPNLLALNAQEPQPLGGVHGTAVASVVGAQRNGVGIEGIYPEAVIRSWDAAVGTGTELTSSQIVEGVLAAVRVGRGVINLSLGGPNPDPAIEAAVDEAVARGSLVVAASGNDGLKGSPLSYPAVYPHVLTVAATQVDGTPAPWSSTSRYVDLAAPGAQIPVAAVDAETGAESWAAWDGTSFAAPLVSGAAAWVWTARPTLDAGQVAEILRRTARDISPTGRDTASGFGLLDVPAALAAPAPVNDPSEPNDDVADVVPGRADYRGARALTTAAASTGRTQGRVDRAEDARDVYRVWLPKGRRLTATVSADASVSLRLVATSSSTVTAPGKGLLARSAATTATTRALAYRNGATGRWALVVVAPSSSATTTYSLSVSAR